MQNESPDRSTFEDKLEHILVTSARVFAERGYDGTSMRDISRASGVSLAGLYYYFRSKEELLFLIQDRCFGTVLDELEQGLAGVTEPRAQLAVLVENHLRFFGTNMTEMKVLSHEASTLTGDYRSTVDGKKRRYRQRCEAIVERLGVEQQGLSPRVAALALFGMLNWIYNWYRPGRDVPLEELAAQMTRLFLDGCATGSTDALLGPGSHGA